LKNDVKRETVRLSKYLEQVRVLATSNEGEKREFLIVKLLGPSEN
jgi:hypothetical protein